MQAERTARPSRQLLPAPVGGSERFWSHVRIGGPTDCWPWTGARKKGYGMLFWIKGNAIAHRVAYALHYGEDPGAREVLHACDNPPCCNPAHLSAGTHGDNMRDAAARGRLGRARGERNGQSRLTVAEVRAIRASSESTRDAACRYGVSKRAISLIRQRKTWKDVA